MDQVAAVVQVAGSCCSRSCTSSRGLANMTNFPNEDMDFLHKLMSRMVDYMVVIVVGRMMTAAVVFVVVVSVTSQRRGS